MSKDLATKNKDKIKDLEEDIKELSKTKSSGKRDKKFWRNVIIAAISALGIGSVIQMIDKRNKDKKNISIKDKKNISIKGVGKAVRAAVRTGRSKWKTPFGLPGERYTMMNREGPAPAEDTYDDVPGLRQFYKGSYKPPSTPRLSAAASRTSQRRRSRSSRGSRRRRSRR